MAPLFFGDSGSVGRVGGCERFDADEFILIVEDESEAAANAVVRDGFVQHGERELNGLAVGGAGDDGAHLAAVVGGDFFGADVQRHDEFAHASGDTRGRAWKPA